MCFVVACDSFAGFFAFTFTIFFCSSGLFRNLSDVFGGCGLLHIFQDAFKVVCFVFVWFVWRCLPGKLTGF